MSKEKNRGSDDKGKKKAKAGKVGKAEPVAAPTSAKASKDVAGSSVIMPCSCVQAYQDSLYGRGQRVFNVGKEGRKCTVCGSKR